MRKYIIFITLMVLISCQLEQRDKDKTDTLDIQSQYQGHFIDVDWSSGFFL